MPEQILPQGKILGTEEFLLAGPAEGRSARSAGERMASRGLVAGHVLVGHIKPFFVVRRRNR
jgi:hypothetical protein